ncbi:hypothetical protein F5X97DRAFT_327797 [Nemania serpens]|nr:hypothetical protein F5X97DRAFT_327797 [Nemania serpens]
MAVQEMRDILYENFENYRQGITWDENRRRPFEALGGNAPVIHNVVNANVRQLPIYLANGGKVNIDTVEDLVGLQNSIKAAHNGLQRLKKYIMSRSNAERFVYQRCLGWGGFGLATVFDVRDEDGQRIRGVVVKMLLDNDEKLLKEEIDACMSLLHLYTTSLMMHIHARSEHILQLAEADRELLDEEEDPPVEAAVARRRRRRADYEIRRRPRKPVIPMIMLELLENGDLSHFIVKVRERYDTIPNRVLWRFFLCLVRMCIGLTYPPDRREEYNGLPGPIKETVPDPLKRNPSRIVHFDIDPKNVLIGDFVGDNHEVTPLLKLGDFGLATEVADNGTNP